MTHVLWLIFLGFWRVLAPIIGIFSLVWAPYVFWKVYRRSRDAVTATKAVAKMLLAAWTIEPIMVVSAICLGAALLPFGLIPVLGPIFIAMVFQAYAKFFNRVNASFYLPGKMTVRFTSPHIHHHHGDYSNPVIDDFREDTDRAIDQLGDYYSFDSDTAPSDAASSTPMDSVNTMQGDQATSVSWQETVQGSDLSLEEIFLREQDDS